MAPGFSDELKELVRARTDLVSLISETVTLIPVRGGREYKGLCQFHDDNNPSMHVYPDRQTYRCWVCQEGGDCFSWVMKLSNVAFPEALAQLARRASVELPQTRRQSPGPRTDEKHGLYDVLAWAEERFHHCLLHDRAAEPARRYLKGRGLSDETIAKFRVGYHPDEWSWLLDKARGRFTTAQLLAARLAAERSSGNGYRDNFVGRVMFPIHDHQGRPVAFGGRILPGNSNPDLPKYWNSPESALFTKSNLLYGFGAARPGIRRSDTAVVVEGYTDCIISHQFGVDNAVGTLGTSLTEAHVAALKRMARKVVLVYDGDAAGRLAAGKSLGKFLVQQVDLRILTLPEGLDPAEYLERFGGDGFRKLIDEAAEAWEHKLQLAIELHGLQTTDARGRVLDDMLQMLAAVASLAGTIREDLMLGKLARQLYVPEETIRKQLAGLRRAGGRSGAAVQTASAGSTALAGKTVRVDGKQGGPASGGRSAKDDLIECEILEIIFAAPESVKSIQTEIDTAEIGNIEYRQVLECCYRLNEQGVLPACERVLTVLEDPKLKQTAVWIDEQARQKQIALKLQEAAARRNSDDGAEAGGPLPYLEQAIQNVIWRREQAAHENAKAQMAARGGHTGDDHDALAALVRAAEFHKKRSTKQTLH